jgi:cytochrome b
MQKTAPGSAIGGGVVRVWDLPTRLFHWTLVALLVFSYTTGQLGKMELHVISGKLILSLVLFRLLWGFVGSENARFASFLKGPAETIRYAVSLAGGTARRYLGHNPMGGWSAAAMILLVAAQACSGLFATDDIYTDGPLKHLVSDATSKRMTAVHSYAVNILIVLIVLHLGAVLFYWRAKKDNLVLPMITGDKRADDAVSPAAVSSAPWLGPLLFVVSLAIVFGGIGIYGK